MACTPSPLGASWPRLDPSEAAILSTLRSRRGEIVPISDLMPPAVRGNPTKRNRLFRVRLYNLREKMCEAGFKRHWIETVRGVGYRLDHTGGAGPPVLTAT